MTHDYKRHGTTTLPELVTAVDEHVAHHSTDPKPFIWTKSARDILQKVIRANARSSSKQNETLHWFIYETSSLGVNRPTRFPEQVGMAHCAPHNRFALCSLVCAMRATLRTQFDHPTGAAGGEAVRRFSWPHEQVLATIIPTVKISSPTPSLADRIRRRFDHFLVGVEIAGLVLIGLATAFAMAQEALKVVVTGNVTLTDLLLMFLYLEVLAMNIRYLRLGHLPVRFPLYIAMAALARDLILRGASDTSMQVLMTTIGIVLLAAGALVLRFGQHRFPTVDDDESAP